MKKILTAVIALTVSMSAFAQSNFSIGAGAAARQITENVVGYETENFFHTGFTVDAMYGYDFTDMIGLNTGLRFTYLFQSDKVSALGAESITLDKDSFLDLPVHVKFTFNPDSFCKFFASVGPTAELWTSYATSHIVKYVTAEQKRDVHTNNHFKEGAKDLYNRFNVSAGAAVGVEIADAVRITLGYDYYFLNMLKNNWDGMTGRYSKHQIRLGVAYVF